MINIKGKRLSFLTAVFLMYTLAGTAQTDADAIMIPKNALCSGVMYSHSSWKNYWEGDFKRDNQNIGTLTTQMFSVLSNYGITNKLNVMFNVPYVQVEESGGTLKGLKGIQDLSVFLKWMPLKKTIAGGKFSLYGVGGVSTPLSGYVADFMPMAIGNRSTNIIIRGIGDYQLHHWFVTVSGMYGRRSNINIDRVAYYTTEMHYTNEVKMPDVAGFNVRSGYRSSQWIAEAILDNYTTLGGFDIRKNDMPFPSNKMNATKAGVNVKYSFTSVKGLELTGGSSYVLAGRNMGQSTMFNAGVLYIIYFSKKKSGN